MQEEELLKEKERQNLERERIENEFRQKQEEIRMKKKIQEEEELERLLLEVGDVEIEDNSIIEDHDPQPITSPLNQISDSLDRSDGIDETKEISSKSTNQSLNTENKEDYKEKLTKSNIQFQNFQDLKTENKEARQTEFEEPVNVWSSLRQIKQSSASQYETIFSSKTESSEEKVSLTDIDDMIQSLATQIAEKRLTDLEKLDQPTMENQSIKDEEQKETQEIPAESDEYSGKS